MCMLCSYYIKMVISSSLCKRLPVGIYHRFKLHQVTGVQLTEVTMGHHLVDVSLFWRNTIGGADFSVQLSAKFYEMP